MRVALRAREVAGAAISSAVTVERGHRDSLADLGLGLRVDDNQRSDDQVPLGPRHAAGSRRRASQARRQRTIRVWVSSGPRGRRSCPRWSDRPSAPRRCASSRTAWRSRTRLRDSDRPTTPPMPSSRRTRRRPRARRGVAAAQSRRAGDHLRDAGCHRHGRRPRGRSAAQPRLPRHASSARSPYPGIPPGTVVRQQPPAASRWRPPTRSRSR